QHFGRNHALDGAAHAETQTRHNRRQGGRQNDLEKNLLLSSAEGARHFDQYVVDLFYAGHGVDDDDEDREEKDHRDARLHAEPEPQDQHRHEGGGRRRHERVDVEVKKMLDG